MGDIYTLGAGLQIKDGVCRKISVIPTIREGQEYDLSQLTEIQESQKDGLSELWQHVQKGFLLSVCQDNFDIAKVRHISDILENYSQEIKKTLDDIASQLKLELNNVADGAKDPYKPDFIDVAISGVIDGKLTGSLYVSRALPTNDDDLKDIGNVSPPFQEDKNIQQNDLANENPNDFLVTTNELTVL